MANKPFRSWKVSYHIARGTRGGHRATFNIGGATEREAFVKARTYMERRHAGEQWTITGIEDRGMV